MMGPLLLWYRNTKSYVTGYLWRLKEAFGGAFPLSAVIGIENFILEFDLTIFILSN